MGTPVSITHSWSRSFWTRLTRGYTRVEDHGLAEFLGNDWPEQIMEAVVSDRYHAKQGRSIGRWKLQNDHGRSLTVYLKRHHILSRIDGLLATLFPNSARSPAWLEWNNLAFMRSLDIPVARAVAVAEFVRPLGVFSSVLVVEELTEMLPLHEAIPLAAQSLSTTQFQAWKRRLIRELARLTAKLHARNVFHKDLYLCHFYIREKDCQHLPDRFENYVSMIDFHRTAIHMTLAEWYRIKDLAQLGFSTSDVPSLTLRDQVRFWKEYRQQLGQGSDTRSWRAKVIVWKWHRYLRHNHR